jgi:peptidoglycan hydrolase CwlO-like protein
VPDALQTNSSGYLTVNNDPVIWTTVNAVKELNEVVQAKDAKIQELENRLANLEKTVQALNGKE